METPQNWGVSPSLKGIFEGCLEGWVRAHVPPPQGRGGRPALRERELSLRTEDWLTGRERLLTPGPGARAASTPAPQSTGWCPEPAHTEWVWGAVPEDCRQPHTALSYFTRLTE